MCVFVVFFVFVDFTAEFEGILTNFSANVARSHVASLFVAGGAWSALRVFFLMTQPISCIFAKRMELERRQCYCTEVQWYAVSKPPRDCESQKTVMCFSNDGIFSLSLSQSRTIDRSVLNLECT